jgi:hypothetical protein
VQYATTGTAGRSRIPGEFFVKAQQQLEKLGVLQQGMAHLAGLLAW